MKSRIVRSVIFIGAILTLSAPAYAQEASLTGTVTDSTGGVLPEHLWHQIWGVAIALIIHTPVARMLPEGPCRQGLRQPRHEAE